MSGLINWRVILHCSRFKSLMWPHLLQFLVPRGRTHIMIALIRIIFSSQFFIITNCQLAYILLHYHHFRCSQNIRNYHESVRHQYFCTSSFIQTCLLDVNDYSHNSAIFLDNFCGYIDGQNALQRHTIWNIHLKPNINIHFLKFGLFDNYWYCDYEYLKVYSNNKTFTFCGYRLPWVYDAYDTEVKIILMTQRTGAKHYQLEFFILRSICSKLSTFYSILPIISCTKYTWS